MSYSRILHTLQQCCGSSAMANKKHIIRFTSRREYLLFMKQLKKDRTSLAKRAGIQPIRIIHSISCTLSSIPRILHKGIRFVEEDTRIRVHQAEASPDPDRIKIPWGVRHIRAPEAWKLSTGKQVHVGVIDTGADYSHPDLKLSLGRGINFVQRGSSPYDDNGHGTHIAGTIAALTSSDGIVGTAPGAIIHPIKAFDRNGSAYVSDIIQGIEWCIANRIKLINMSFGMDEDSRALQEAIRNANRLGVLMVASAGNDGKTDQLDIPARYPQTIAVGATNRKKQLARFSNRGRRVQIYAPGYKVYSTWLGGRYSELSGTSMATSHVTGAIALLWSVRPNLTPSQIRLLLRSTGRPVQSRRWKNAKELDAYRLVKQAAARKK